MYMQSRDMVLQIPIDLIQFRSNNQHHVQGCINVNIQRKSLILTLQLNTDPIFPYTIITRL